MSVDVPRFGASAGSEQVVAGLREHGAVVVEGVLNADLLARFNAELDPLLEQVSPDRSYLNPLIDFFYGKRVRQITGLAASSRVFGEEILCHSFYDGICAAILGPNCSSYQLNVAQVMERGPGAEQQILHRDEDVWVHLPRPHPEVELASVIALKDFRAETGATVVAPGSHLWDRQRQPKPEELACAEMPAGSAVVYLGSTIHAGGANTTSDEWRRGMHVSFAVGWLRTEDNNYLSTPLDVARSLPRRSQELLGYAAHDAIAAGGGYLGTVDLLDPIDLIADGKLQAPEIGSSTVDIDVPLVRRLVAAQLPQQADLPIRPVAFDGWDNRTFRLGDAMSVRLPSAEAYTAQVEKEPYWLPRLAPQLPLPIPVPLALGAPGEGYPWPWSVYRWLEGEIAEPDRIGGPCAFATALAGFLTPLQQIDPSGGPLPGLHNFFRGGPLTTYDGETRDPIEALHGRIDTEAVTAVWEAALAATWHGPPVWLHGDVAASNLLVRDGRLHAVIDFGCSGVGDPACDLVIAWTFFSGESREAFRAAHPADDATWARARGWALWKGLILQAGHVTTRSLAADRAQRAVDEVLADHELAG